MQQVITMQDLRLPKFDKTGTSNLLMGIVFDNDNVKYNIILSTNLLSKTGFKSNCSEGTWNVLITPPHFVHLEVWIRTNSMLWNACSTSKSKMRSLIKIDSKSLQQRFWMPSIKKTDVADVMKGLTHLDAHQKQTCLECYRKTKRCLMKLLMFIHMKRFSKKDNRVRLISNSRQSENIGIHLKRIHIYEFI
jgi:hypothetical protein